MHFDLPCCWVAYAYLVGCLSSIDETLCPLLQGELASFVEFDVWFDSPWFYGEYALLHWETSLFGYYPLEFGNLMFTTHMAWFEEEFVVWLGLRGSWCLGMYIVYFAFLLHFLHTHLSHLASHVILAYIYLIMPITVLGW
jgi:hypothetical protein